MSPPFIRICKDAEEASLLVAAETAAEIQSIEASGEAAVLGLATGATPIAVYQEWCRLHQEDGFNWRNVHTFNLDEYWPLPNSSEHSYHRFMENKLFNRAGFDFRLTHIPNGMVSKDQAQAHCEGYEKAIEKAGGIDIQILGIGINGHLGFNEPGSSRSSATRLVELSETTRNRARPGFGSTEVPRFGITMGLGTILESATIYLLAFGEDKAEAISDALQGPVTEECPCSLLQEHPNVKWILDSQSAAKLSGMKDRG